MAELIWDAKYDKDGVQVMPNKSAHSIDRP